MTDKTDREFLELARRGGGVMKLTCLIFGCKWGEPVRFKSYGEVLVQRKCQRCGTLSTVVEGRKRG